MNTQHTQQRTTCTKRSTDACTLTHSHTRTHTLTHTHSLTLTHTHTFSPSHFLFSLSRHRLPAQTSAEDATAVLQSLQYENTAAEPAAGERQFKVTVTDGGGLVSAAATLVLAVQNINDQDPYLLVSSFTVNEGKSGPVGRLVVVDPDKGQPATQTPTVTLVSASVPDIRINAQQVLVLTRAFDADTEDTTITATVLLSDGQVPPRTATQVITVTIANINDNQPVFVDPPSLLVVPELTALGAVIATLTATDADRGELGRLQYSITHATPEAHPFQIDAITAQVYLAEALDFDAQEGYRLTIQAADQGSTCVTQDGSSTTVTTEGPCIASHMLVVSVANQNSNPPTLAGLPTQLAMVEGQPPRTPLSNITASENDNLDSWQTASAALSNQGRLSRLLTCPNQASFAPRDNVWHTCGFAAPPSSLFEGAGASGGATLLNQQIANFPAAPGQGVVSVPLSTYESVLPSLRAGFHLTTWVRQAAGTDGQLLTIASAAGTAQHLGIYSQSTANTVTVVYQRDNTADPALASTTLVYKLPDALSLAAGQWRLLSFSLVNEHARLTIDCTPIPLLRLQYIDESEAAPKTVTSTNPAALPSRAAFPNETVVAVGARPSGPTSFRFHFTGDVAVPSIVVEDSSAAAASQQSFSASAPASTLEFVHRKWCCVLGCGTFVTSDPLQMRAAAAAASSAQSPQQSSGSGTPFSPLFTAEETSALVPFANIAANGPHRVDISSADDAPLDTATLEALLRGVVLGTFLDEPARLSSQTLALSADDGAASVSETLHVAYQPTDDQRPVVNLGGSDGNYAAVFVEDGPAVLLSSASSGGVRITDADLPASSNVIVNATVTLLAAADGVDHELLSWDTTLAASIGATVTLQHTDAALQLTVVTATSSGFAPDALAQLLSTIRYQNTADEPTGATRAVAWIVWDGAGHASEQKRTLVSIATVNNAPRVHAGGVGMADNVVTIVEGEASVLLCPDLVIFDSDSTMLTSLTLTLLNAPDSVAQDAVVESLTVDIDVARVLGVLVQVDADADNNFVVEMTLASAQGSVSLGVLTALARTARYTTTVRTPANPSTAARAITVQAVDDSGASSEASHVAVLFTAVNNAPIIDLNGPAVPDNTINLPFVDGSVPLLLAPQATLQDVDSVLLSSMSILLRGARDGEQEGVALPNDAGAGGLDVTHHSDGRRITVAGDAPLAAYAAALRQLSYFNFADEPVPGARALAITVADVGEGDTQSATATATLTITVEAINDYTPYFLTPTNASASVEENVASGVAVTRIAVADDDLGSDTVLALSISKASALVNSNSANSTNSSGSGANSTSAGWIDAMGAFAVEIVEEHEPACPAAEDVVGQEICASSACSSDEDCDGFRLCCALLCGSACVDPVPRMLLADVVVQNAAMLDYESFTAFSLALEATDGERVSRGAVAVSVTNLNDNDPVFVQSSYAVVLPESHAVGDPVVQLRVADADIDSALSQALFTIQPHANGSLFAVDASTGLVRLAQELDREAAAVVSCVVSVADAARPQHISDAARVVVLLTDVNEASPQFALDTHAVVVAEDVPVGFEVLRTTVTDSDLSPPNNDIAVSLVAVTTADGNSTSSGGAVGDQVPFELEVLRRTAVEGQPGSVTFRVVTNATLDREAVGAFALRIGAVDGGDGDSGHGRASFADVAVVVSDANDNAPVFDPVHGGSEQLAWAEDTAVDTPLIRLRVQDADAGDNARLTAAITAQTPAGTVRLQEVSSRVGELVLDVVLDSRLDREAFDAFSVRVLVSDQGPQLQLTSVLELQFSVADVNDNAPMLTVSPYARSVTEAPAITTQPLASSNITDADAVVGIERMTVRAFTQRDPAFDACTVDAALSTCINGNGGGSLDATGAMLPAGTLSSDPSYGGDGDLVWDFNGDSAYGVIQEQTVRAFGSVAGGSFSSSCWIRTAETANGGYVYAKTNAAGNERFYALYFSRQQAELWFFYQRPRSAGVAASDARVRIRFSAPQLADNEWHHVAVVINAATMTAAAFVDGAALGDPVVEERSDAGVRLPDHGNPLTSALADGEGLLLVGARSSTGGATWMFDGLMSSLVLSRAALNRAQLNCIVQCAQPFWDVAAAQQGPVLAGRCADQQATAALVSRCSLGQAERPLQELRALQPQNFDEQGEDTLFMTPTGYTPRAVGSLSPARISSQPEASALLVCTWLQFVLGRSDRTGYLFAKTTVDGATRFYALYVREASQELWFYYKRPGATGAASRVLVKFSVPALFEEEVAGWHHLCIRARNGTQLHAILDGLEVAPSAITSRSADTGAAEGPYTLPLRYPLDDGSGVFLLGARSDGAAAPSAFRLPARVADTVISFAALGEDAWRCIARCGALLVPPSAASMSAITPAALSATVNAAGDEVVLATQEASAPLSVSEAMALLDAVTLEINVVQPVVLAAAASADSSTTTTGTASSALAPCVTASGSVFDGVFDSSLAFSRTCIDAVNRSPPVLDLEASDGPRNLNATVLFVEEQGTATSELMHVLLYDSDEVVADLQLAVDLLNPLDGSAEALVLGADADTLGMGSLAATPHSITGRGSITAIVALLSSLGYTNTADEPAMQQREVRVLVADADGAAAAAPAFLLVTMESVDDAPLLTATANSASSYKEDELAHAVFAGVVVEDSDSTELRRAMVEFVVRPDAEQEILFINDTVVAGVADPAGLNVAFDAQVGILVITGLASVHDYTALLSGLLYRHLDTEDPALGQR